VRGQHLVVRGHDADVRLTDLLDDELVVAFEAGEPVGQIRARKRAARREFALCVSIRAR
jgi:hypothetical protein